MTFTWSGSIRGRNRTKIKQTTKHSHTHKQHQKQVTPSPHNLCDYIFVLKVGLTMINGEWTGNSGIHSRYDQGAFLWCFSVDASLGVSFGTSIYLTGANSPFLWIMFSGLTHRIIVSIKLCFISTPAIWRVLVGFRSHIMQISGSYLLLMGNTEKITDNFTFFLFQKEDNNL